MGDDLGLDGMKPGGPHAPTPHPPSRAGLDGSRDERDGRVTQPYYEDDLVTLYHGDCLEVMAEWWEPSRPAPAFDLVFTSPPYNLGTNPGGVFGHWKDGDTRGGGGAWKKDDTAVVIDYADHDDAMPYDDYLDWQRAVVAACWDVLTPAGAIFYNHKPRVQRDGLLVPLPLVDEFPVRQIIVWDRGSGFNFTPTAYTPQHEWIIVVAKHEFRLAKAGAAGDVWRIPPDVGNAHPAPFPVGLPGRAIDTTQPKLVLDPFAGSGTTLRAAADRGIKAVGIERSERYCEMAVERLAQRSLFGASA